MVKNITWSVLYVFWIYIYIGGCSYSAVNALTPVYIYIIHIVSIYVVFICSVYIYIVYTYFFIHIYPWHLNQLYEIYPWLDESFLGVYAYVYMVKYVI